LTLQNAGARLDDSIDSRRFPVPVSQRLLDILACPVCKIKVEIIPDEGGLKCPECKRVYPIKDDIPIMLPAEATIDE
jgi:uncharacterized protein